MKPSISGARFAVFSTLALCALASSVACSSTETGGGGAAKCDETFYVDADAKGRSPGPLSNEECPGLCGKAVFSCSIATVEGTKASVECVPDCASNVGTSATP